MILTISGLHGTGKSTVGKKVATSLGIRYYSTGQAFRDMASEMKMTLEEFTKYVETHPEIDNKLDDRVKVIAKEGNIILDSQLSAHILGDVADVSIILICPLEVRVKRMAERDDCSYDEKLKETTLREESELKRFKSMYGIDLNDIEGEKNVYDVVIDTQDLTIEKVVSQILSALKTYDE